MGYHYVNFALNGTTALAPNVLLYVPGDNGKLKLVAVEYVVFSETLTVAPTIFGQTFFGPMTHGIPRHSSGNDKVTCP